MLVEVKQTTRKNLKVPCDNVWKKEELLFSCIKKINFTLRKICNFSFIENYLHSSYIAKKHKIRAFECDLSHKIKLQTLLVYLVVCKFSNNITGKFKEFTS